MDILGVIPARGESKSIPRKNLADLAGKPLLAYTAECALKSRALTRVILSTDDPEIAKIGRSYGLEVPFLRPPELAQDQTLIVPVLQHLLQWLEENENYYPDVLVLLQPTSPFRRPQHIDEAVRLLIDNDADTVVSVVPVPHNFIPASQMQLVEGMLRPLAFGSPILRRQDKPVLYARNGPAVLTVRPNLVKAGKLYSGRTFPLVMDRICSIDIDGSEDLLIAQHLYPLWLQRDEPESEALSGRNP